MTTHTPARARRGLITRISAVGLLAAAATLGAASPALAHDELIDQSVIIDETGGSVSAVQLTFNNEILDVGTEIHVTDADGADVTDGDPVISGRDVQQPLGGVQPDGPLNVVWRVVSSDGHPIEGSFSVEFQGEGEDLAYVIDAAPAEHEHDDEAEQTDGAADHDHDAGHDHDAADDSADHDHGEETAGTFPWLPLLATAGGVVVVVVAIALFVRKSRGASAFGAADGSSDDAQEPIDSDGTGTRSTDGEAGGSGEESAR